MTWLRAFAVLFALIWLPAASGISIIPLEGKYETAAAITTLVVAAGTAASEWYSQTAATNYIKEGCAK